MAKLESKNLSFRARARQIALNAFLVQELIAEPNYQELRVVILLKRILVFSFLTIFLTVNLLNVIPVSSTTARLSSIPRIGYGAPGESILINITVSQVESLYAWQVNMSWNPNVLEWVNVTEGEFLESMPQGTFGVSNLDHVNDGWALFGWSSQGEFPGLSGSGVLGRVRFQVSDIGESQLRFEQIGNLTYLLGQSANVAPPLFFDIPFTPEHGVFINTLTPPVADFTNFPEIPGINQTVTFNASTSYAASPFEITEYFWDFDDGTNATVITQTVEHSFTEGGTFIVSLTVFDNATATALVQSIFNTTDMPRIWYELYGTKEIPLVVSFAHNIILTNVVVSETEVTAGEPVSVNVTVKNGGSEQEDFTVTVYYGAAGNDTREVEALDSLQEKTLIFSWDTTDVAEGNYQIRAVASTVEDETYTEDNVFIDGTVTVNAASEPFPTTLIVVGALGAGVVLAIVWFILTRRKHVS